MKFSDTPKTVSHQKMEDDAMSVRTAETEAVDGIDVIQITNTGASSHG